MPEYIERDKALEEFDEWAECTGVLPKGTAYYAECRGCIEDVPAADVAPVVHGRWETCFEDWRKEIEGDRCSACGFEHYGSCISNYNYCPNCGAKMDLGAAEDERTV